MKMKKIVFRISLFFILTATFLFMFTYIDDRKDMVETNTNVFENLVNNSLSVQYDNSNVSIDKIFTKRFIDDIPEDNNFYKKNLRPYKIINKQYIKTLRAISETEFEVSVQIEDMKGSYIQIMYIVKEEEVYLISCIEYDI